MNLLERLFRYNNFAFIALKVGCRQYTNYQLAKYQPTLYQLKQVKWTFSPNFEKKLAWGLVEHDQLTGGYRVSRVEGQFLIILMSN